MHKQLFIDLPRRYVLDIYERDPDFFQAQGIHMFCGPQGCGKTMACVEMMADFIKYCSDSFYASLDEFSIVFREAFGAACFIGLHLFFFLLLIGLISFIYETVKEKLISWKQRKSDNDA